MAAHSKRTSTGVALRLLRIEEVGEMALPKKKGKRQDEDLVHIPHPRETSTRTRKGHVAQTFLNTAQHEAFTEWVDSLNLSKAEYLRWLITDAVVNHRRPPSPESE